MQARSRLARPFSRQTIVETGNGNGIHRAGNNMLSALASCEALVLRQAADE